MQVRARGDSASAMISQLCLPDWPLRVALRLLS